MKRTVNPKASVRRLTALLVISGSLNIILVALFFYWNYKERPPTPYFELKPASAKEQQSPLAVDSSDSEVIRYFRRMPLEWLVSRLSNTQLVENGYTQRDLALASLVTFHNFDLDRALAGQPAPQQKRSIHYGKFRDGTAAVLTVFPGLSDKQYAAIVNFASTERWPLTGKGLFLALQKEEKRTRDPSLVDGFLMTPEFTTVEMLFSRNVVPVDKEELLAVVLESSWEQLGSFVQQQKVIQDLSPARRQAFLLSYIQNKSRAAAYLMLKTDGAFAARKLDDAQVLQMLELLDRKTLEGGQFAVALLTSPRSDTVWQRAAARLYEYSGEPMPQKDPRQAALARFAPGYKGEEPKVVSSPMPVPTPAPLPPKPVAIAPKKPIIPQRQDRVYVVQDGDSLWKISRRFNVDMDVIRAYNQLDSDILRPGRALKIPN